MKIDDLRDAMGGSVSIKRYRELLPAFNQAMIDADCTTVNRAAMFCAQIGHESAGLRYMEEIASGAAYEGRRDLGNTKKGDGKRFKGRGPIQVTGRANYTELSKWAHQRGMVPNDRYFVKNPGKLASDKYGFVGVVWYWTTRNLNRFAPSGDVTGVTRVINGGLNGLQDRQNRWVRCKRLGKLLLPEQEAKVAKSRGIRKGDLVQVVTTSGLIARSSPRGKQVQRNGRGLVRPYGFRARVARSRWINKDGGQRWVQGTGGIWYCARNNGTQYMQRVALLKKNKDKGKIETPVPGYRATTAWRKRPNNNSYWQSRGYHTGTDFAAPQGAKIVAIRPGTVHRVWDPVLGNVCLLYADNGCTYWYCHLRSFWGKRGRKVKAGMMIGKVGQTGSGANGPHLHLERRKGHGRSWAGNDLNPMVW